MGTTDQFLICHNDLVALHWMARRYADGRQTAATSMFNELTRRLLAQGAELGKVDGTPWARDGGGRKFDGLTTEEAALGREVDWYNDTTQRRVEELQARIEELKLAAPTTVYEVVDATDDEMYYPLGLFTDPAKALSLLDGAEPPYSEDNPESVTIEVRGRKLGFNPHSFWVVAKRTWERVYDDSDSGTPWRAHPIETP